MEISSKPLDTKLKRFMACPRAALCVSTEAANPNRSMLPIKYQTTLEGARQLVKSILEALPKTRVVTEDSHYIHAECKTALFAFTEHVEFYFDEEKKEIHFQSLSTGGLTDFGSNKRRMQKIQAEFFRKEQSS